MKKQKTVIMLEDIKENMLGEKHESLLDENKMLRELLKSALDENKKFCEDLELKQKEVDSYKKMNIEGKEEYGNLRKLYDGAKAERNEYFRMYSELLNENKDLKKSYENFVKAKNAQYLRKRKTSSQKDVDTLNLKQGRVFPIWKQRTSLFIKRAFTLRSGLTFITPCMKAKTMFSIP